MRFIILFVTCGEAKFLPKLDVFILQNKRQLNFFKIPKMLHVFAHSQHTTAISYQ